MKKSELRQIIREELNRITEDEEKFYGMPIKWLLKDRGVGSFLTRIKLDRTKTYLTIDHIIGPEHDYFAGKPPTPSIVKKIDSTLDTMGIPNLDKLKKLYPSYKEKYRDYREYFITFNIKKK